jgi:hypothetical protein
MKKRKLILDLAKAALIIGFLWKGLSIISQGQSLIPSDGSEMPIYFQKTLQPSTGPHVGTVKVTMTPTYAFVIGDYITAQVQVEVFAIRWEENESCMVQFVFPDAFCYVDSWSNMTEQDWTFILWDYQPYDATHVIFQKNITIWYIHEGSYGLNMTVWEPERGIYGTNEFYLPNILQVRSLTYLEEKRRAALADSLNIIVVGLAYIAIAPVAVQLVDIIEKVLGNLSKKQRKKVKLGNLTAYE